MKKRLNTQKVRLMKVSKKMIADAYLEGHKEGYAAREQEIPMEIRDRKTKYIDLGLPSGTLWATDYEKQDGEVLYLPYCEARTMKIPTEEQLRELYEKCKWHKKFNHKPEIESMYCIGPNGRKLSFTLPGIIKTDEKEEPTIIRFWIRNNNDKEGTKAAEYIPLVVLAVTQKRFSQGTD